ncbi:MAG: hypothetical protein LDL26_10625 [Caenispirillum bisanense]|nr:hypothetical protein [Caenispirillum bisanense]MCA1974379.1 hypothetical protein [Caenispirillum sp.]
MSASPARTVRRLACAALALPVLAACSGLSLEKETPPPCPQVRIDRMTAQAVTFQGEGRDITDMLHKVDLAGYQGECDYQEDQVVLALVPGFTVEKGPAAGSAAEGSFQYFVAIPSYYPSPAAKEVFGVTFQFPDPVTPRMRVADAPVTLTLPRKPGESLEGLEIYLGLQLTPEQLQYNRQSGVR